MGHKEDLLEGAKRCLIEKGYARTTARDIVQASGTNLASIGYHYGSKEALLNAAVIAAIEDWSAQIFPDDQAGSPGEPMEAFERNWIRLVNSFDQVRTLMVANFEAFSQAERVPELRHELAEAHQRARRGLVAQVLGIDESAVTDEQARTLGSLLLALIPGVMTQFLVSPEQAPTGAELVAGLRTLTGTQK